MKTIVIWLLVAVSNGAYNDGTVTVIAEYENQQLCEQTAEKKPKRNKADWYLSCVELLKEVKE